MSSGKAVMQVSEQTKRGKLLLLVLQCCSVAEHTEQALLTELVQGVSHALFSWLSCLSLRNRALLEYSLLWLVEGDSSYVVETVQKAGL